MHIVKKLYRSVALFIIVLSWILGQAAIISTDILESDLRMAGFYPFVAPLPIWTFDVENNYAIKSQKDTLLSFTDLAKLTKQSSGIETVSREDYLLFVDTSARCSPGSSLLDNQLSATTENSSLPPYLAQLRCDSLPSCTYFVTTNTSSNDIPICSDGSWKTPYSKSGSILGVKKSQYIGPALEQYEIMCNYSSDCPDAFTLMRLNITAEESDKAGRLCSAETKCKSFSMRPGILKNILFWDLTMCSVIPAAQLHYGTVYGVKPLSQPIE